MRDFLKRILASPVSQKNIFPIKTRLCPETYRFFDGCRIAMVEKEEEDLVRRMSRCGLGVPRREIDLGMRCKANGLMPICQALLGNRHRHNGAIATQQMQAPTPRKSETPAEQFARPTVSNLRADKPEKRYSDITDGFFELFQHFLDRPGAPRRTTNEVCSEKIFRQEDRNCRRNRKYFRQN